MINPEPTNQKKDGPKFIKLEMKRRVLQLIQMKSRGLLGNIFENLYFNNWRI
jgi:hypothetical protein